jgi:hypothetical protein
MSSCRPPPPGIHVEVAGAGAVIAIGAFDINLPGTSIAVSIVEDDLIKTGISRVRDNEGESRKQYCRLKCFHNSNLASFQKVRECKAVWQNRCLIFGCVHRFHFTSG